MSTKNIALDSQVYRRLSAYKKESESFSKAIARILDDIEGAIAVLEPGLGEVGPVAAVAEPLADFYTRMGRGEALVALCGDAAERCEPGPERGTWHARRAAELRLQGDGRGAVEAYRAALVDRPDDSDAKAALRDLYRAQQITLEAALANVTDEDAFKKLLKA